MANGRGKSCLSTLSAPMCRPSFSSCSASLSSRRLCSKGRHKRVLSSLRLRVSLQLVRLGLVRRPYVSVVPKLNFRLGYGFGAVWLRAAFSLPASWPHAALPVRIGRLQRCRLRPSRPACLRWPPTQAKPSRAGCVEPRRSCRMAQMPTCGSLARNASRMARESGSLGDSRQTETMIGEFQVGRGEWQARLRPCESPDAHGLAGRSDYCLALVNAASRA